MNNICLKFIVTAVFILAAFPSTSQSKYIHQGSYWFRYYNQTRLSPRFTLHFEVEERRLVNPSRQFQFFSHLHLHYQIKPWLDMTVGGNYNSTNSPQNQLLAVPEFRPWQEISISKKIGTSWQFQFRYRLDERFVHNNDKIQLLDGYRFNLRHRLRVQFQQEIKKISDTKSLALKLSNEVMLYYGNVSHTFDQNRFYVSLDYRVNRNWSVETGYLNLLQWRSPVDYYERHVFRVTLNHRIDLRKSKEE